MQSAAPQPPSEATFPRALEATSFTPQERLLFRALLPCAQPLPPQSPCDWIPSVKPLPQSFPLYQRALSSGAANRFGARGRSKIYLQPLGEGVSSAVLRVCASFLRAFYVGCAIEVLPVLAVAGDRRVKARSRDHGKQYDANSILELLMPRVLRDAYALIAVSDFDIYSGTWNFLYGLAKLKQRVGVFSFARYDPHFWGDHDCTPAQRKELMEYRAAKVMLHEVGHMFGLKHCVHMACLMQGSMHDEEAHKKPLFLSLVCLRRLRANMGFSLLPRFQALAALCKSTDNPHLAPFHHWYAKAALSLEEAGAKEEVSEGKAAKAMRASSKQPLRGGLSSKEGGKKILWK